MTPTWQDRKWRCLLREMRYSIPAMTHSNKSIIDKMQKEKKMGKLKKKRKKKFSLFPSEQQPNGTEGIERERHK